MLRDQPGDAVAARPERRRPVEEETHGVRVDALDLHVAEGAERRRRGGGVGGELPVEDEVVGSEGRAVVPGDAALELPDHRSPVGSDAAVLSARDLRREDRLQHAVGVEARAARRRRPVRRARPWCRWRSAGSAASVPARAARAAAHRRHAWWACRAAPPKAAQRRHRQAAARPSARRCRRRRDAPRSGVAAACRDEPPRSDDGVRFRSSPSSWVSQAACLVAGASERACARSPPRRGSPTRAQA